MTRLLLVSGSLREGSTNSAALRTAAVLAPGGVEATVYDGMGRLTSEPRSTALATAPGRTGLPMDATPSSGAPARAIDHARPGSISRAPFGSA